MDATEMFLRRHQRLHSHVERLSDGLTEAQVRGQVHPSVNPMAWLLWHVARVEDATVNLLVTDGSEVLTRDWCSRLAVDRRDVGSGMTMDQVLGLCACVDLAGLAAYWRAVGQRTVEVVRALRPADLDEVVSDPRIHQVARQSVAEKGSAGLERLWQGTACGDFLAWLPLTHNSEHIGQAELIRGMLGHAGRF